MMPGMNPKMMKRAMQQMGMHMEEIDAEEVIIRLRGGKEIVITEPQVSKIKAMGQESFQITGESSEREVQQDNGFTSFTEDDVKLVMETAAVTEKKARDALTEANGDIAKAILILKPRI